MQARADDAPAAVRSVLTRIAVGDRVSPRAFADAFTAAAELISPLRDVVLGSLMTAVMAGGPGADEVVALVHTALAVDTRAAAVTINGRDRPVLMVAGSGKKGLRTFNVSTPAAIVAAAAGAQVVKVGSAATSSVLGSRELVRALGLPERRTVTGVRADLAACGFAFVAIEPQIPILDGLYGGRFYAPNPFSFGLAPLVSPVRGDITVFGLAHPRVECSRRGAELFRHVGCGCPRHPAAQWPLLGRDRPCRGGALVPCARRPGRVGADRDAGRDGPCAPVGRGAETARAEGCHRTGARAAGRAWAGQPPRPRRAQCRPPARARRGNCFAPRGHEGGRGRPAERRCPGNCDRCCSAREKRQ